MIDNFEIGNVIGTGQYGVVYRAIDLVTNQTVAVKMIMKGDSSVNEIYQREIQIMHDMHHPLITECYYDCEDNDRFFIIMEYVPKGSLLEYVNNKGNLNEVEAQKLFVELVDVLEYLHQEKQVVHRDLKADNILLDENLNIKLIDFGMARPFQKDEKFSSICGSPAYEAPEIIRGEPYTDKVDIWSIGIILYAMLVGRLPFCNSSVLKQTQMILNTSPVIPSDLPDLVQDLINGCLIKDPTKRLSLDEVMNHPWVYSSLQNFATISKSIRSKELIDNTLIKMMNIGRSSEDRLLDDLLSGNHSRLAASYKILRKYQDISTMKLLQQRQSKRILKFKSTADLPILNRNARFSSIPPRAKEEEPTEASILISRVKSRKRSETYKSPMEVPSKICNTPVCRGRARRCATNFTFNPNKIR